MSLFSLASSTVQNIKSAIHDVKSTVKHEVMTNGYYKVFSPDCFAEGSIKSTTTDALFTVFSNLNSLDLTNQLKICKEWKQLGEKPEYKEILLKALDHDLASGLSKNDLQNLTNVPNLVLAYLKKGFFNEEIFGEELLKDEKFMFEALKHNNKVLKCINEDFQLNHPEEILALIEKSPESIQFATPAFQMENKHFIAKLAMQPNNIKVMFPLICTELKKDKEFQYLQRENAINQCLDLTRYLVNKIKDIEAKYEISISDDQYEYYSICFQRDYKTNLETAKNDPELIEKVKKVFHSISMELPKLNLSL